MKMTTVLVTEDDKVMQSCSKESQGYIGNDLCAPDTLDLQGTYISVFVQYKVFTVNNF
jgi:hypothetical protein